MYDFQSLPAFFRQYLLSESFKQQIQFSHGYYQCLSSQSNL